MDAHLVSAIAESITAVSVIFLGYQSWLLKKQAPLVSEQVNILKDQIGLLKSQSTVLEGQLHTFREQLQGDHARSRREWAIQSVRDWTNSMTPQTISIEKLIEQFNEGQCECLAQLLEFKVETRHKNLLESCLPGEIFEELGGDYHLSVTQVANLRFGVMKYLNTLEGILAAWQHNIAERPIIEEQFRDMLRDDPPKHTIMLKYRSAYDLNSFPAIREFRDKQKRPPHTAGMPAIAVS